MPLTTEQVADLQAKQSRYGCGADGCKDCYPIQYGCDFCTVQFPAPIANGEHYTCEECGYDNKDVE